MGKIAGYILLGLLALGGIYQVSTLNNVSDVIAESNRKSKIERAAVKAEMQAEDDTENLDANGETDASEAESLTPEDEDAEADASDEA